MVRHQWGVSFSYWLPLVCVVVIGLYALSCRKVEKEVINIVVSMDQVDRVFEKIYLAANLDTPGMGIIYITPLEKAATYVPPDIVKKLEAKKNLNPS